MGVVHDGRQFGFQRSIGDFAIPWPRKVNFGGPNASGNAGFYFRNADSASDFSATPPSIQIVALGRKTWRPVQLQLIRLLAEIGPFLSIIRPLLYYPATFSWGLNVFISQT